MDLLPDLLVQLSSRGQNAPGQNRDTSSTSSPVQTSISLSIVSIVNIPFLLGRFKKEALSSFSS